MLCGICTRGRGWGRTRIVVFIPLPLFLHFHLEEEGKYFAFITPLTRLWERGEEYIWRDLDFSLPGKCLSGD